MCASGVVPGLCLPQFAAATVDSVALGVDLVTFLVRAKAGDAACSGCGRRSSRVHARYQREKVMVALAGRPGSRLATELAMPSCRDVLIRLVRAQPIPVAGHIAVLGVDDFPIRRG